MSVTRRQAVTFSVIVPLYDCRDAGTDALRAALAQTFARERYEVIAVVDAGADRAGSDALAARLRIDAIDAVLCTHHNDLGLRWLLRLLAATGRAKARHYAALENSGVRPRVRHPVYRGLRAPAAAIVAAWPLRLAGPALILASMALVGRWPGSAHAGYRAGVGCTDVSGYCGERASAHLAKWFHIGLEHRHET